MTTIAIIMVIVLPRFKKVQKLIDKLNGVTRENLTGIRVVRAFNAEQYQEEKFDKANNNLTNQQLFNQKSICSNATNDVYNHVYGNTINLLCWSISNKKMQEWQIKYHYLEIW